MNDYESWEIKGHTLEYYDEDHQYICDGLMMPSITEILATKFHKYDGVSKELLKERAAEGTRVHEAIEKLCKTGVEEDLPEVRNFLFLSKAFGFEAVNNEVPVILFHRHEPLACGRLDLVIRSNNGLGLADIKRTSVLDRDYLFYQLNLYRMAYEDCYDEKIDFLVGLHLKGNKRRYAPIPINPPMAWELVMEYMRREE